MSAAALISSHAFQLRRSERTSEKLGVLLVDEGSEVSSVVEDHVEGGSSSESADGLLNAPLVLLLGLSLPGVDGDTGGSDTSRQNVALGSRWAVAARDASTHAAAAWS